MKRLYRNALVLLPDFSAERLCVVTEGERISFVGEDVPRDLHPDETIDLSGCLLMPGLVNAHGHSAMTLLRGIGGGLPLQRWLNEAIFPIEAKMSAADIKAGMTWAIMEMLRSGTTCVADMYDFPEAGAEALMEAGFKANICRVGLDFPWAPGTPAGRLGECVNFVRDFKDPTGKVVADFCLHSEYLTTERLTRAIAEANSEFRRPVHLHVSETVSEHEECKARHNGLTPIAYFAETGLLDYGAYCAHCVHLEDSDFAILREKGATVVHNPTSNMKLGSGFARIADMRSAGVSVALGTDGTASNDNLNMFEEMHLAALLQKGILRDPTLIPAKSVLEMSTIAGAKALGRDDTGSVEVGKKADFCILSLEAPHLYPAIDIANLLVYSAQGADVVMTVVDGEILYDHGVYPTIDAGRAKFDFDCALRRLGVISK